MTFPRQPWWRHQMETFSALLAICAGNSPHKDQWCFHVYFDLRPNKRLSKQSWGWWFETLWRPLWRHRNDWEANMDGLVQDCSNSIANALELLQSYTKPSIYSNSQEAHGNVFTLCFALVWLRLSSVKCNHICKGYITGTEKSHTRFA